MVVKDCTRHDYTEWLRNETSADALHMITKHACICVIVTDVENRAAAAEYARESMIRVMLAAVSVEVGTAVTRIASPDKA